MKLSDRCRKEARDFYLYDNKDCVEWKAADLLDECERALKQIANLDWADDQRAVARSALKRLRAQEKADE